jgi:hypothetical protein
MTRRMAIAAERAILGTCPLAGSTVTEGQILRALTFDNPASYYGKVSTEIVS